jgi:hypothetical protein
MHEFALDSEVLIAYLTVYSRWSVGGILLVAGFLKLRNIDEVTSTVKAFRIVTSKLVRHAAWMVEY